MGKDGEVGRAINNVCIRIPTYIYSNFTVKTLQHWSEGWSGRKASKGCYFEKGGVKYRI